MPDVEQLLAALFGGGTLRLGALSDPRKKSEDSCRRVSIRPIVLKNQPVYQFESQFDRKVLHQNLAAAEAHQLVRSLIADQYRQGQFSTDEADYQVVVRPNGQARVHVRPPSKPVVAAGHDRQKQWILPEGQPQEFLIRLGIMGPTGQVLADRRDKFKQINRFLEMVAAVADHLPPTGPMRAVDFGCGKAYLTFALHHYLHVLQGCDVQIIGLDARQDVIETCDRVAHDLHLEGLEFRVGTIRGYQADGPLDMVVALHACNTATDDALAQAVAANAAVILAAPCCQHELRGQIENSRQGPLLRHGILKERLAALVTDGARAALLESFGYAVQVVEFIDPEHTPKNLLIRAVRRAGTAGQEDKIRRAKFQEYLAFRDFWNVSPSLETALTGLFELSTDPTAD